MHAITNYNVWDMKISSICLKLQRENPSDNFFEIHGRCILYICSALPDDYIGTDK